MAATVTHPKFEASALADLAGAFARRGKAIRYDGKLSIAHEVDADGMERLNVDFASVSSLGIRRRLSAWASRNWWFLACQSRAGRNAGWLFEHELRGDLILARLQEIWQVQPLLFDPTNNAMPL
jgi:hypothetical protein